MTLSNALATKVYFFLEIEQDSSTRPEFLLALAKDIFLIREKLINAGKINWSPSVSVMKHAQRISGIYINSLNNAKKCIA